MFTHVHFERRQRSKRGPIDYTFFERHGMTEIAFGSYNNGMFELINCVDGRVDTYRSAAVAFLALQHMLEDKKGFN